MLDSFLNFYSKYPWVAVVMVVQWLAAGLFTMNSESIL